MRRLSSRGLADGMITAFLNWDFGALLFGSSVIRLPHRHGEVEGEHGRFGPTDAIIVGGAVVV